MCQWKVSSLQTMGAYMGFIGTDTSNVKLGFGGLKPGDVFSTAAHLFCFT